MGFSLGIDTGGTHTDLVLTDRDSSKLWTAKVPTTPDAPLQGVLQGIDRILSISGRNISHLDDLVYGTTLVTNMIVQHEAVKTGLITTKGFRDVLEIGRAYRTGNIYDIQMDRPPPLVSRDKRYEVSERVNFQGNVLEPLDEDSCRKVVRALKDQGVESIAVCLIHSYINPSHEREIKRIIREEFPDAHVSLSSEINPVFREFERTSTTVLNAFVAPRMVEHLDDFQEKVGAIGFHGKLFTMQANGGKGTFEVAKELPVNVTNSGPIGGAVAGSLIAKLAGYPNAITLDMGGTSCDVALIEDGEPRHIAESTVEGYPVQISTIDLSIVGAGGGSIAWIDKGRALRVGPQSAGADPGPACYSSGGSRPTVTDANLVAGRLSPEYFLGGEIQLDPEAALESIDEHIASKINLQPVEAALGIIQVANATMVRAIRLVSVERGYDPHDFALVAFGGAGPLHAVRLAEELEIPVVIVPRFPGNTSALGLVFADVRYDHVATRVQDLQDLDASGAEELFQGLERKALIQLSEQGIPEASRTLSRSCDMRYLGQAHELNVPFQGRFTDANAAQQIGDRFEYAHRRIHGHAMKGDPIVIVNFRVTAVGGKPQPNLRIDPNGHTGIQKGFRRVFFNETSARAAVFERAAMGLGSQIAGPAIIEQPDSTTLLHPGQIARVDAQGNLLITLTADGQESDGSKSDNS